MDVDTVQHECLTPDETGEGGPEPSRKATWTCAECGRQWAPSPLSSIGTNYWQEVQGPSSKLTALPELEIASSMGVGLTEARVFLIIALVLACAGGFLIGLALGG